MPYNVQKQHSTRVRPTQIWPENVKTTPTDHERTMRRDVVSVVTSGYGGKFLPIKMIPLLREDACSSGRVTLGVQMAETAEMLLNPVRVSLMSYLVPKLAFERFTDMGSIDRSYNGEAEIDGSVIPWFEQAIWNKDTVAPVHSTLGMHRVDGRAYNLDYLEAYNTLWNYLAMERSPSLTPRDKWNGQLAPAFWEHTQMKHIKPTFDDAMMDGQVPLTFVGADSLPVISEQQASVGSPAHAPASPDLPDTNADGHFDWYNGLAQGRIWAELKEANIQLTLANIDLARETRAWSQLRNQYQGISEDWMIDQLLQGIRLNDANLKVPQLIDHSETIIGMSQRYASDAGNLDKSLTDGRTSVSVNVRTPPVQSGGVVVVAAQILPEMIYERQVDYYFTAASPDDLPNRTADELDPQPVELITNSEITQDHSLPDDLFGYGPLGHRWVRNAPNIGGKYYKPLTSDPFDENRNRIWDSSVVDPVLGPDFYLSETLSHEVFADANTAPFELWLEGEVMISGLTYFAPALREALGDYDAVMSQVDTTRVKGDGTDTPTDPV